MTRYRIEAQVRYEQDVEVDTDKMADWHELRAALTELVGRQAVQQHSAGSLVAYGVMSITEIGEEE